MARNKSFELENWHPSFDSALSIVNSINSSDSITSIAQIQDGLKHLEEAIHSWPKTDPLMQRIKEQIYVLQNSCQADNFSETSSMEFEQIVEDIFSNPRFCLATYGTLQPGECNHHIVAEIKGDWIQGTIFGSIHIFQGYPRFRWKDKENPVPVSLLYSEHLPEHYERIDQFEGRAYKRALVPVQLESCWQVANVYVAIS